MKCFSCKAELGRGELCPGCGINVKVYKKIKMASNAYYNEALEKAKVRDLSGAAESLKMSLRFDKTNIDARNLLGLVYYEMGEMVAALTEWVISKNCSSVENAASRYLNEIQNNPSRLDSINQTIKKYNQALQYCRQDSRYLAVIQLKKVLSMNPKLVSGHQLLALLYIQEQKYDLAKKSLQHAAKIDVNNTVTLRYQHEVEAAMSAGGAAKKAKNKDQVSYQSGNETIIQPKYGRDYSPLGTVLNMVFGIAIGVAITWFLVVPGVRREVQNNAKAEVVNANNELSSRNQTISTLEAQVDELTQEVSKAEEASKATESRISSYEQLVEAYHSYNDSDIEAAGQALTNVNTEYLNDSAKTVYDTINAEVNAEYLRTVYKEGTTAYNASDFETAIVNFEKVAAMDETYDNGNVLYYLAQAYRKVEDIEHAKVYYQKVVDLYPGSERAAISQNYLASEQFQ